MTEFTSKSGIKVRIEPSTFANAIDLKTKIEKALLKENIDVANVDIDFDKIRKGIIDMAVISSLSKVMMIIDSSDEVHKAIFVCLERCLYNSEKITLETFEPIEARADYYEILMACIKENLSPFLKTLFAKLPKKPKSGKTSSSQSQNSQRAGGS